jgi:hypothetical protein
MGGEVLGVLLVAALLLTVLVFVVYLRHPGRGWLVLPLVAASSATGLLALFMIWQALTLVIDAVLYAVQGAVL